MKTFVLCLFIITAVQALAATYYVRTDGVNTNNGLTNSAGGAFLTIAKAVTVAQAGDTISIQAGTFPERATTARHGANGTPIVIQGQGDTTILGGVDVNHDYIHIKDCQLNPFGSFVGEVRFGYSVNANKITGFVGNYGLVDNVTFKGSASRCKIYANTPYYTGPLQTHIKNSRFLDSGPADTTVLLAGCESIVENCYFSSGNSSDAAVGIFGRDNVVRSNVFENWRKSPTSSIHVDVFQAWTNNDETSVNQIIERNLIIGDGTGSALGQMTDMAASKYGAARQGSIGNWTFRNNIVIGHGAMFQFNIPDVKVYNNTFVSFPKDQGIAVLVRSTLTVGTAHNARIFNNIFYKGGYNTAATNVGFFGFDEETGSAPIQDFQGNNNLVIGTGAGTVKSTAIWTKYGANANGLNGIDPLLVNPINPMTAADVQLQVGSPAIGAGQNLSATGFTTDYYGNERGAAWDIGAIEYNSGDTPTDTTPPTVVTKVIDSTGTELSVMFSENVFNVAAAHYALSGGQSLTYISTIGPLAKFTISPSIQAGAVVTLSYTSGAGRTADAAGNLLATFSGAAVTNNSLEPTPSPPRAGRRGKGATNMNRPVGR